MSQVATAYYFGHFLIVLPLVGWLEKPRVLPYSISAPVLKGGRFTAPLAATREAP
jgi:ubiquinol-cytochrome c reductase cytochrome b subunit